MPPRGAEGAVVNAAGLVQGIALVTFPAASTIFTSPSSYDLSHSQYRIMLPFLLAVAFVLIAALPSHAPAAVAGFRGQRTEMISIWRVSRTSR